MQEMEPSLFHMAAVIVFSHAVAQSLNHTEIKFTAIFYNILFNSLHITFTFIPLEGFSREGSCLAPPAWLYWTHLVWQSRNDYEFQQPSRPEHLPLSALGPRLREMKPRCMASGDGQRGPCLHTARESLSLIYNRGILPHFSSKGFLMLYPHMFWLESTALGEN